MIENWDFLAWPNKQTEDTNTYEIMNIILWQIPFVVNKAVHIYKADEQNMNIDLTHYGDYVYQMYTCLHCIIVAVLPAAPFIDLLK